MRRLYRQMRQRNRGIIRQWKILRELERPRTLAELTSAADDDGVTDRTIRRDLDALQAAGFAIFDTVDDDGRRCWQLMRAGVAPARRVA